MTDDIEERAVLARRGIMDHSDCEDCVEDWTFLMLDFSPRLKPGDSKL